MIKQLILVGLGGGVGSMMRFLVSKIPFAQGSFPWATFAVNIVGSFLIGILIGLSVRHQILNADMKLLLVTGFCGGFTTFSAFSAENVHLYQSGNYFSLAFYILLSIVAGFAAVLSGLILGK
ncbi:MAG: fluoride efflux transporter CrcB [Dysgonamonadaceae bacterium]|jgi:CrcB protein|nr:fluoride efflux transporter CrcB [Dysgonamonadaceae bacterium]